MSKKSCKKVTKPLGANEPASRPATTFPTDKSATNGNRLGLGGATVLRIPTGQLTVQAIAAEKPIARLRAPGTPEQKGGMAAPSASPDQAAVGEKAPTPTPSRGVEVTFVLLEPEAKLVSLCGEFNGWAPGATPLKRREDGLWDVVLTLAPGRYEYKFWVDGQWLPDPLAHENVWNQHGTLNSVVVVRA